MSSALYSEDDEDDYLSSLKIQSGSSSSTLSSRLNSCERAEAAERSDRYELAVEVLETVSHEFYDKHVRLAQEEIDNLKSSNKPLLEESPWIAFLNSTDGEDQVIRLEEAHTIILENAFDESEELYYYCCAPASQNMEEQEFSNFVPHADAPEFNLDEFLAWDEDARDSLSFPWQNLEDPDRDIIDVEVARILHYKHQFTFKEIDKLGLLRLSLRGPNDNPESGLLWMNSQRETIEWQSSCSAKLQLPRFPTNFSHGTLLEAINAGVYHFCANPTCITSHCATHYTGDIRKRITQPFEPCEPKETQEGILLKYAKLNPCSKFCFMTHLNEETIETCKWRVEDEQELRDLLALIPDANPCDLAVMCRKRCYEKFNIGFTITERFISNQSLKITLMNWATPYLILLTIPAYIKVAVVPRLPTVLAILRGTIVAENVDVPKIVPIAFLDVIAKLRKQFQIEIKPSERHGNGAFACKSVRKNQLIGGELDQNICNYGLHFGTEYVGEIQGRNTTDEYQIINKFRELNYIFDYKKFEFLNSATMGNELRYLNHDSEIFNCKPEMMQCVFFIRYLNSQLELNI
ncbi:hypothetical protein F5876DRAFT_66808 [Lentinula aff. lateritia]|uniref:Uncharacterized protein n=1 Tax=Lentinula aff. lateritia TaxID=2804960 RepID=A0ACC1TW91_9AGAR|nr:hypothetical protein F5876DRAFT_66808 [Lentinula aff. lateritia]